MRNARALIMLGISLVIAAVAVFFASRWLEKQGDIATAKVVVAKIDIAPGTPVTTEVVGLADWPRASVPKGKAPGDNDWYAADLGTNAFGQGVAATPLQMATAASAIANNGVMMTPQIVRSVINSGYQHNIEQRVIGMPIKPETARTLSEMLAVSLETESSDALVEGYRVSGKTGTAEIPTPFGYTSNATNASFVGWGPTDDPQFLVYVWLEKPQSSVWGSVVAAPVFRQAMEKLVVLLNIPPDDVRRRLTSSNGPQQ